MTEAEVLAYLLQHKKTTASELVHRFNANIVNAHRVLLRLERKGLVEKIKVGRNVEFKLAKRAERLSRQAKQDDANLPLILFLGLAAFILLIALSKDKNKDETKRDETKRD